MMQYIHFNVLVVCHIVFHMPSWIKLETNACLDLLVIDEVDPSYFQFVDNNWIIVDIILKYCFIF